jgi:hypothetical protein
MARGSLGYSLLKNPKNKLHGAAFVSAHLHALTTFLINDVLLVLDFLVPFLIFTVLAGARDPFARIIAPAPGAKYSA